MLMGVSAMKSVRPVESTRLNAPGDMEENIVSKISKPLVSSPPLLDIELSRHELNNGSFMSNRVLVSKRVFVSNMLLLEDWGVKADKGALEVDEGIVLNPLFDCPVCN